jgi:hypothetical protein
MWKEHPGHLQGRRDINRSAPDRSLPGSLRLPVKPGTPWAFGGSHLEALFVTASREGLDHATRPPKPDAGRLFSNVKPGLRGRRCQAHRATVAGGWRMVRPPVRARSRTPVDRHDHAPRAEEVLLGRDSKTEEHRDQGDHRDDRPRRAQPQPLAVTFSPRNASPESTPQPCQALY